VRAGRLACPPTCGLIRGAKLIMFKNGGYGIMYQYPEKFSETVVHFPD
jgi:hypothetical protein